MRGVLRASLASASVGAQRFHARGHRLRLGLRLRMRSELAGHTLAAIWLRSAKPLALNKRVLGLRGGATCSKMGWSSWR